MDKVTRKAPPAHDPLTCSSMASNIGIGLERLTALVPLIRPEGADLDRSSEGP